jgi:hypothetical protein
MIKWLQKCHAIEGYDASKCAEDCQKAETEDFAKNCTSGGGFFKCCIRYSAKISWQLDSIERFLVDNLTGKWLACIE